MFHVLNSRARVHTHTYIYKILNVQRRQSGWKSERSWDPSQKFSEKLPIFKKKFDFRRPFLVVNSKNCRFLLKISIFTISLIICLCLETKTLSNRLSVQNRL